MLISRQYPAAKLPAFSCQPTNLACGNIYSDTTANKTVGDLRSLALSGRVVAQGNMRVVNGLIVPFSGFSCDETFNPINHPTLGDTLLHPYYETQHLIETTDVWTHWILRATVKLFRQNPRGRMQPIRFKLIHPQTGAGQTLCTVRQIPSYFNEGPGVIDPATLPADIHIPEETETDIMFSGQLSPAMIPMPGNASILEFRTSIAHEFSGIEGNPAIEGLAFAFENQLWPNYWAGIKCFSLKFFRNCN